jgi:hypothetical protein
VPVVVGNDVLLTQMLPTGVRPIGYSRSRELEARRPGVGRLAYPLRAPIAVRRFEFPPGALRPQQPGAAPLSKQQGEEDHRSSRPQPLRDLRRTAAETVVFCRRWGARPQGSRRWEPQEPDPQPPLRRRNCEGARSPYLQARREDRPTHGMSHLAGRGQPPVALCHLSGSSPPPTSLSSRTPPPQIEESSPGSETSTLFHHPHLRAYVLDTLATQSTDLPCQPALVARLTNVLSMNQSSVAPRRCRH